MRQERNPGMGDGKVELPSLSRGEALVVAGAGLLSVLTGCKVVGPTPGETGRTSATATTEAFPTASPEVILAIEKSAQTAIDQGFSGLGIHEPKVVGGPLKDALGTEFALFKTQLPDKKGGRDLEFLMLGQVNGQNSVENIKGLVVDENAPKSDIVDFLGVTYDSANAIFNLEGPFARTNVKTGEIEIFRQGVWIPLLAPVPTMDAVKKEVALGVLAAPALPTPTSEPTPTPEVIPAFIPEGFSEGPAGLLRNPETGQDTIVFNKDADWKQTRENIIGGLWEINVDWSKWTGQETSATLYPTKESFIKAAEEGKKFHIGIPVRLDGNLLTETPDNKKLKSRGVVLKMVDIKLDSIQVQALSAREFIKYTGKDWGADTQPAFDCAAGSIEGIVGGSNACLFTIDQETLIISIGSFYQGDRVISSKSYNIGSFEKNLHEKYPTYFRDDGIGVNADNALAFTLGYLLDAFPNFKNGHSLKPYWTKGLNIKSVDIGETQVIPDQNAFYLQPPLFKFSQ